MLNKQSEYNEADTLEKLQERMDKESRDFVNSINNALQRKVETNNVNTFDRLDNIEKLLESVASRKNISKLLGNQEKVIHPESTTKLEYITNLLANIVTVQSRLDQKINTALEKQDDQAKYATKLEHMNDLLATIGTLQSGLEQKINTVMQKQNKQA